MALGRLVSSCRGAEAAKRRRRDGEETAQRRRRDGAAAVPLLEQLMALGRFGISLLHKFLLSPQIQTRNFAQRKHATSFKFLHKFLL